MEKPERALAIRHAVKALDLSSGRDVPSLHGWLTSPLREIAFDKFRIQIFPDSKLGLGSVGGNWGERIVSDPSGELIIVAIFGKWRFAAQYRGEEVRLFHYQPGEWERTFGTDPGADTVPILLSVAADWDPVWHGPMNVAIKNKRDLARSPEGLRPVC